QRRREALPSIPDWIPQITGADAILGVLLVLCAYAVPIIGGPIAGLFAYFAHQKGDVVQRNVALFALGVAVLVVLLVSLFPGAWPLIPWVDVGNPLRPPFFR